MDLEILDEALGDADDHVGDEAAGGAVQRAVLARLGGAGDDDGAVSALESRCLRAG